MSQETNTTNAARDAGQIVSITKRGNRFFAEDETGLETELPTKREVCPRCDGIGKHDYPAFSNGITASEWNGEDWDDDSRADYLAGRYDVRCEECGGNNVVSVPDEDRMSDVQVTALHDYYNEEASYRAEQAAERRMGC